MYKMWNRQLGSYSPNIEVIFYDKNFKRLGKIHCAKWYAKLLPGEWKSPIAIYSATNGTMGFQFLLMLISCAINNIMLSYI